MTDISKSALREKWLRRLGKSLDRRKIEHLAEHVYKLFSIAGLVIGHVNTENCILIGEMEVKQSTRSERQYVRREND